jgi:hypothetical protein
MEFGMAYRRYLRLCLTHADGTSWDVVDAAWLAVGWKQRQSIPILQRICEEKPFNPLPNEDSFKNDSFHRSLQFTNWNEAGCAHRPLHL